MIGVDDKMDIAFQKIFDILSDNVSDDWQKIVLYAEYGEGSYLIKYFVKTSTGKYIDCYAFDFLDERKLNKVFSNINNIIAPARKEASPKDLWYVMTMIVDDTGHFRTEYEYEDISEHSIDYYMEWKKKYLV